MLAKKREYQRERRAKFPNEAEDWRLRHFYGISLAQYHELFAVQRGLCLLCNKPPKKRRFVVDHDHDTGIVRGLMHSGCNSSFRGIFGDDPLELHRAFMRLADMTTHITVIVEDRKSA